MTLDEFIVEQRRRDQLIANELLEIKAALHSASVVRTAGEWSRFWFTIVGCVGFGGGFGAFVARVLYG